MRAARTRPRRMSLDRINQYQPSGAAAGLLKSRCTAFLQNLSESFRIRRVLDQCHRFHVAGLHSAVNKVVEDASLDIRHDDNARRGKLAEEARLAVAMRLRQCDLNAARKDFLRRGG